MLGGAETAHLGGVQGTATGTVDTEGARGLARAVQAAKLGLPVQLLDASVGMAEFLSRIKRCPIPPSNKRDRPPTSRNFKMRIVLPLSPITYVSDTLKNVVNRF